MPNLALNKPTTVSSACNPSEAGSKAVNGTISGGWSDKWCALNTGTKWLQVDLGVISIITQFAIKHSGAGGENPQWNTRDFNIQVSHDGVTWYTVTTIVGNTANVTVHNVAASGRYVRLNITAPTSTSDAAARIYEFETHGTVCGIPQPVDTPPSAPTNLRVTGVAPTTVTLSWDASTDDIGVINYEVFLDSLPTSSLTINALTGQITGLTPSTTHTFNAKAIDTIGQRSTASNSVTATTTAAPPQALVYQVNGRFLHDPNGDKVIVRGPEQVFWQASWLSTSFIDEIAKSASNTVRILPYHQVQTPTGDPALTLAQIEDAIIRGINGKMLVDVAINGPEGAGSDPAIYFQPAVKTMLMKYEKYIVIHAKGEGQEGSDTLWRDNAKAIITSFRNAGYRCPLYILANTFGRKLPVILQYGQEIFDHDPLKNVVFGWIAYWGSSNYYQNLYGMSLSQGIAACAAKPFPIQLGLIRFSDPGEPMDWQLAMNLCQSYQLGWTWWDWRMMQTNQLTNDGVYGHWANVGEQVMLTDQYSIRNTSVRTAFQLAQGV